MHLHVALCWQVDPAGSAGPASGRPANSHALLRSVGLFADMLTELEQVESARAVILLPPGLLEIVAEVTRHPGGGVGQRSLDDLLAGYHLDWLGVSVREGDPRIRRLLTGPRPLAGEHRQVVREVVGEQFRALRSRLRALVRERRVELALLSGESQPEQLGRELDQLSSLLGVRASGCWPRGDGAPNPASAPGLRWMGSNRPPQQAPGEETVQALPVQPRDGHEASATETLRIHREELLCGMIERCYPLWPVEDAVANCAWRLENLAHRFASAGGALVVITACREGGWERFGDWGTRFRRRLYQRLSSHPRLRLTTLDQVLSRAGRPHSS